MKVVRIIARLNVGGPARHVVWLNAGLNSAGYETVLVAGVVPPGEDDMSYFALERGIEPVIIPQMSREISAKDALTIWKLYRLFRRERPDIVHTHTAKAGTVGRIAGLLYRWLTPATFLGRPRRCRFVHTYHGHIFHSYYGRLKTRFFLLIEKVLARLATDRIVVISPQQFREIHEEFGVGRAQQFTVVPLGLDTGIFNEWERRRERLRSELCAGRDDILVGIVGRLTEVKNHALFLEMAAYFKEKFGANDNAGARVRFIIIGDGNLRDKLEAEARALFPFDEIKFLGTRNDPENFYPALDVVALTSLNEGTPLTLIEAMANARPLIATEVGGVVDLLGASLREGSPQGSAEAAEGFRVCEHGIIVRPMDVAAFAHGLARLILDEDLRRAMGMRGRRFVEQNYSKERLLKDVTNLYQELAGEKSVARSLETVAKDKNESLVSDSRLQTPDSRLNKGDI